MSSIVDADVYSATKKNQEDVDMETVKLAAKLLIIKYKAIARKQQEVQTNG